MYSLGNCGCGCGGSCKSPMSGLVSNSEKTVLSIGALALVGYFVFNKKIKKALKL